MELLYCVNTVIVNLPRVSNFQSWDIPEEIDMEDASQDSRIMFSPILARFRPFLLPTLVSLSLLKNKLSWWLFPL
jgi:hypothetical protein